MIKHLFFFLLSLSLHACALKVGLDSRNPNAPISETQEEADIENIFGAEQPCLNEAVTQLPFAAQEMAQKAYKAIQAAIHVAEITGVAELPDEHKAQALKAIQDLCQVADVLHVAIHEADARAPSP